MEKKLVFRIFTWKNVSVSHAFKNQIIDNCKCLCSPTMAACFREDWVPFQHIHTYHIRGASERQEGKCNQNGRAARSPELTFVSRNKGTRAFLSLCQVCPKSDLGHGHLSAASFKHQFLWWSPFPPLCLFLTRIWSLSACPCVHACMRACVHVLESTRDLG